MHNSKKVVSFGEVLWDIYPEERKLGGAPFNVAAHLTMLGTQGHIITKVGSDELGADILSAIKDQHIDTKYVQVDNAFSTGIVNVNLDMEGKPTYDIDNPSAWDFIEINPENRSLVKACDALIYGSLACRTSENLRTLKNLLAISKFNICDLNLRQAYYSKELVDTLLSQTNMLKVNDDEAEVLSNHLDLSSDNFYNELSSRYDLDIIIQTKGANGAEAFHNGVLTKVSALKVDVVDTVGSGDAFFAAFIHHYLNGENISSALKQGCGLGAFVATQNGAIPQHSLEK